MSKAFQKMLTDTLTKMSNRIKNAKWDSDNDPDMMLKLKDEMEGFTNKM